MTLSPLRIISTRGRPSSYARKARKTKVQMTCVTERTIPVKRTSYELPKLPPAVAHPALYPAPPCRFIKATAPWATEEQALPVSAILAVKQIFIAFRPIPFSKYISVGADRRMYTSLDMTSDLIIFYEGQCLVFCFELREEFTGIRIREFFWHGTL
jgi:hypothetical protein